LDEAKVPLNVLKLKPEERAKYDREVENQDIKSLYFTQAEVKGFKERAEKRVKLERTDWNLVKMV